MKLGTRVWALITVVVSVSVLAAGWFLVASPLLTAQAQADKLRRDTVAQNDGIAAKIATLEEQKNDLSVYEARLGELEVAIPSDVEAANYIRSLNDLATASNVQITALSLEDPVPYLAPEGDPADVELAPNPVTDSRITGENFLLVPISITITGGWNEVLAFTHGVQTGNRLLLVTTVATGEDLGTFTTSLSGAMYVLVRPPAPVSTDADADTEPAATEG